MLAFSAAIYLATSLLKAKYLDQTLTKSIKLMKGKDEIFLQIYTVI